MLLFHWHPWQCRHCQGCHRKASGISDLAGDTRRGAGEHAPVRESGHFCSFHSINPRWQTSGCLFALQYSSACLLIASRTGDGEGVLESSKNFLKENFLDAC